MYQMRKLFVLMAFLALGMLNVNESKAWTDSVVRGNYEFEYKPTKGGYWITQIIPCSDKGIETLAIPEKIKGKKVVKLGPRDREPDEEGVNLFGVSNAPDEAKYGYTPKKIHIRTEKIKKIQIPETVKVITPSCFNMIQHEKSINIPQGVSKDVEDLVGYNWKKFKISSKNKWYKIKNGCLLSKDGKVLYGPVIKKEKIVVPKTVKIMKSVSVAYDGVSTIILPKSLKKIEDEGLNINTQVTIKIAKGNKTYGVKYGCIYNKKTGRLVAGSAPNGVFQIPEGVIYATSYDGFLGKKAQKIIVPASVEKLDRVLGFFEGPDGEFVMKGKKPPKFTCAITNGVKNVIVYVPKGCISIYEQALKFDRSVNVTYIEQEQ
nr:hypothetical protein [Eubacterium sp.]